MWSIRNLNIVLWVHVVNLYSMESFISKFVYLNNQNKSVEKVVKNVIRHRTQIIRHRIQIICNITRIIRHITRSSVIEDRSCVIKHRSSVIEHRSSVIEYRSSVIDNRSSVIDHRLSYITSYEWTSRWQLTYILLLIFLKCILILWSEI